MADELSKEEKLHQQKMERAVRAVRSNPDLRYMFIQFMHLLGGEDSINPEQTNTAMWSFGRQSACTDIMALLMLYDIVLYADLLREDALQSITETHDEQDS